MSRPRKWRRICGEVKVIRSTLRRDPLVAMVPYKGYETFRMK